MRFPCKASVTTGTAGVLVQVREGRRGHFEPMLRVTEPAAPASRPGRLRSRRVPSLLRRFDKIRDVAQLVVKLTVHDPTFDYDHDCREDHEQKGAYQPEIAKPAGH
jgi:hypothetical protein